MTNPPRLTASADGNYADALNALPSGWAATMGIKLLRATGDEVTAELEIGPAHRQAYGIVHGGVHSGLIETITSVGAALDALPRGQSVVGVENHTSFLLAVREGKLHATARPLMRGRRTQVWEASVIDDSGRLVATGRVRLIALESGSSLAGQTIARR
jgi:uncharacterized protein (TIGR00369 family)